MSDDGTFNSQAEYLFYNAVCAEIMDRFYTRQWLARRLNKRVPEFPPTNGYLDRVAQRYWAMVWNRYERERYLEDQGIDPYA